MYCNGPPTPRICERCNNFLEQQLALDGRKLCATCGGFSRLWAADDDKDDWWSIVERVLHSPTMMEGWDARFATMLFEDFLEDHLHQ